MSLYERDPNDPYGYAAEDAIWMYEGPLVDECNEYCRCPACMPELHEETAQQERRVPHVA